MAEDAVGCRHDVAVNDDVLLEHSCKLLELDVVSFARLGVAGMHSLSDRSTSESTAVSEQSEPTPVPDEANAPDTPDEVSPSQPSRRCLRHLARLFLNHTWKLLW